MKASSFFFALKRENNDITLKKRIKFKEMAYCSYI
jgi:hypothetical protein